MKVALHVVQARRQQLASLVRRHHYIPLSEVCRRLQISAATARRDLAALARDKKITRTHGGALGDYDRTFASFEERAEVALEAKVRIAKAAADFIPPQGVCFFDAGTTLLALAHHLQDRAIGPLVVLTNSLPVAEVLSGIEGMETHLPGGQFFGRQAVLLGAAALQTVRHWKFDAAFLSAEGMTAEGILNSQPDVVRFQQEVMRRSREVNFCLDASKIGHRTPHLLAQWPRVTRLITDATPKDLKAFRILLSPGQTVSA